MRIILMENIVGLGKAGELRTVKDGYARNYLIPQKLAQIASKKQEAHIARLQATLAKKAEEMIANSRKIKETMEKEVFVIKTKSGEGGKLFGSVTKTHIAEAMKEKGYDIDKRKIVADNIKLLGEYDVKIRLDEGVSAVIKLHIVDESQNIDEITAENDTVDTTETSDSTEPEAILEEAEEWEDSEEEDDVS
jgi:large subunit ribosomal protein L9